MWWNSVFVSRKAGRSAETRIVVSSDESGVTVVCPFLELQSIRWNQIDRIVIETNDSGPWGDDVWWVLEGSDRIVKYPLGASRDAAMVEIYPQRFAGFDYEAMFQAMTCTECARFVCWARESTDS